MHWIECTEAMAMTVPPAGSQITTAPCLQEIRRPQAIRAKPRPTKTGTCSTLLQRWRPAVAKKLARSKAATSSTHTTQQAAANDMINSTASRSKCENIPDSTRKKEFHSYWRSCPSCCCYSPQSLSHSGVQLGGSGQGFHFPANRSRSQPIS